MKSADYSSIVETAMRVAMMRNPTVARLMARFSMSRSTASRWIVHLRAAKGLVTP